MNNFSEIRQGENNASTKVSFNGIQATIQSLSQTEIRTIVPLGATRRITVTNSTGSAQSAEPFTVLQRQDLN